MTLFRDGQVVADEWLRVAEGEATPASGKLLLTKSRFLAERESLRGRNAPLGLVLMSGENLDGLEDDIARLSLVVLDIPRYADGRLYSIARLLRERHGYSGELRATGDVLRDQIMFLHRVGIDAFDITHAGTLAALAAGEIVAPRHHLQAAAREAEEAHDDARPWRRVTPRRRAPGAS